MVERAILVIGSGVIVGILGILIKYAGMIHLIAGYDSDQVADDEGLESFIGAHTLLVAVFTVCVGVLELRVSTADSEWYWLVYGIAVFAIVARMVRGTRRYTSPLAHNRSTPRQESE